jgi:uncharacterized protein YcaQ
METITIPEARRLALARAGLLKPEWTGLPVRATGKGLRARRAAHRIIAQFGYLQLDTVSIAGARSHAIVLLSRLEGFDPALGEQLLQPGEPLFEYWGHEVCWLPIGLYPVFEFRRRRFTQHPWWGDIVGKHPKVADDLRKRIRDEGPLRSADMEGEGGTGWWKLKVAKKVASALWSSGELAICERRNFQRAYDLTERVIPEQWRNCPISEPDALERLVLLALTGHGWATTTTIVQTWRLMSLRAEVIAALKRLSDKGEVISCGLFGTDNKKIAGWIRPADLELAARLRRVRPRTDRAVLLSPFDPLLWDRHRVQRLFRFHQVLEIFKPAPKRIYGYYCLPVLAGEWLVARCDLKADWKAKRLIVLSCHLEDTAPRASARRASQSALKRYAGSLELKLVTRA